MAFILWWVRNFLVVGTIFAHKTDDLSPLERMGKCEEALRFDFGVEKGDGVDAGYVFDVDVVF